MKQIAFLLPIAIGAMVACNSGTNRTTTDDTSTVGNQDITAVDTGVTKGMAEDINDDKFSDDSLQDDAGFVGRAAEDGMYEVKVSTDAQSKITSASVKKLASHMKQAHEKANKELAALASKKSITVPTVLPQGKTDDINRLLDKSGNDFDKAFVDELEDKHDKAIRLFEKASDKVKDPDLKAWFAKTLPELRNHLEMVKTEKAKLK
jgi:putative membrane protein